MPVQIITINFLGVNCYLVKTDDGYLLVDTGFSFKRHAIERELGEAGCKPGNLKLIIITHGDIDHTGNAVYFRDKYGAKIAMHRAESGATEKGNMRLNRKLTKKSTRIMTLLLFNLPFARLSKSERFKPDIYVEDGYDLSGYGFDARALHLPGHSSGSVGILDTRGNLFCGDLFRNNGKPSKNQLVDNLDDMNQSIEMLKGYGIRTVYPGHGRSFAFNEILTE